MAMRTLRTKKTTNASVPSVIGTPIAKSWTPKAGMFGVLEGGEFYHDQIGKVVRIDSVFARNSYNYNATNAYNHYLTMRFPDGERGEYIGAGPDAKTILSSTLEFREIPKSEWDEAVALAQITRFAYNPDCIKYWPKTLDQDYAVNTVNCVGSDPEIFVVDDSNEVIPAFSFLPAKDDPKAALDYRIEDTRVYPRSKVFWDGFQAEFTPEANSCLGWHSDATHHCLYQLAKAVKKVKGHLTAETTFVVSESAMAMGTDSQVALGCMPSLNAYNHTAPISAECGRQLRLRSAGCHIHLGLNTDGKKHVVEYIKAMDRIAGVALTAILAGLEDPRRRQYYGLAGEYRVPKYGVEYRVPSSAVLASPWLFNLAVDVVRGSVRAYDSGFLDHWDITEEEAVHIINHCDVDCARAALRRNLKTFAMFCQCVWPGMYPLKQMRRLIEVFMRGARAFVPDITDVHTQWALHSKDAWTNHSNNPNGNVGHFITIIMPELMPSNEKGVLDEVLCKK